MKHLSIFLGLLFLISFAGCKKEKIRSCEEFRNDIIAGDIEGVKKEINRFIFFQGSESYSHQNLNKLANFISHHCWIVVTVLCFDCISTLPSQSEIRILFESSNGIIVAKTIDITYDKDNRMIFGNMHD